MKDSLRMISKRVMGRRSMFQANDSKECLRKVINTKELCMINRGMLSKLHLLNDVLYEINVINVRIRDWSYHHFPYSIPGDSPPLSPYLIFFIFSSRFNWDYYPLMPQPKPSLLFSSL